MPRLSESRISTRRWGLIDIAASYTRSNCLSSKSRLRAIVSEASSRLSTGVTVDIQNPLDLGEQSRQPQSPGTRASSGQCDRGHLSPRRSSALKSWTNNVSAGTPRPASRFCSSKTLEEINRRTHSAPGSGAVAAGGGSSGGSRSNSIPFSWGRAGFKAGAGRPPARLVQTSGRGRPTTSGYRPEAHATRRDKLPHWPAR